MKRFSVKSEKDAILFISQIYYPGWKASVDGATATLDRVNAIASGIPIAPGEHEILLTYDPWDKIKKGIQNFFAFNK